MANFADVIQIAIILIKINLIKIKWKSKKRIVETQ